MPRSCIPRQHSTDSVQVDDAGRRNKVQVYCASCSCTNPPTFMTALTKAGRKRLIEKHINAHQ